MIVGLAVATLARAQGPAPKPVSPSMIPEGLQLLGKLFQPAVPGCGNCANYAVACPSMTCAEPCDFCVCCYAVAPLMTGAAAPAGCADCDAVGTFVAKAIPLVVCPGTWEGQGGAGKIAYCPHTKTFRVYQSPGVQMRVHSVLAAVCRSEPKQYQVELKVSHVMGGKEDVCCLPRLTVCEEQVAAVRLAAPGNNQPCSYEVKVSRVDAGRVCAWIGATATGDRREVANCRVLMPLGETACVTWPGQTSSNEGRVMRVRVCEVTAPAAQPFAGHMPPMAVTMVPPEYSQLSYVLPFPVCGPAAACVVGPCTPAAACCRAAVGPTPTQPPAVYAPAPSLYPFANGVPAPLPPLMQCQAPAIATAPVVGAGYVVGTQACTACPPGDALQVSFRGANGPTAQAKVTFRVPGCDQPFCVAVDNGRVKVSGCGLEAVADKVNCLGDGRFCFEGHVSLRYTSGGQKCHVNGHQVCLSVKGGSFEVSVTGGNSDE
jgi:hypothetical protein